MRLTFLISCGCLRFLLSIQGLTLYNWVQPCSDSYLQIVSKNLSEPIRSHKDLDKDSAPYYHKAVKFFEGISKQLVHQGHVLDLFACALDQVYLTFLIFRVDCMREFFSATMSLSSRIIV